MIKKKDLILAAVILIIALLAVIMITFTKVEGGEAVITVHGKIYKTLPLNEDDIVTVEDESGHYNVIEIKDGNVTMTEANCPDILCVKHRSIHYNHESIVCLPHKVVVEIQAGEENNIDAIAK